MAAWKSADDAENLQKSWRRICQMCSGDERVRELRFRATNGIEGGERCDGGMIATDVRPKQ